MGVSGLSGNRWRRPFLLDAHCISPQGALLGKILVPERVSNVCFGGRAKHRLFVTATTSVYSVVLNREGVQRP